MTTALIVGVSGQTGAYLAHELIRQGKKVVGTSRNHTAPLWRLDKLGLVGKIDMVSLSLHDYAAIQQLLRIQEPDEIYYLAGPSSVAELFREPLATMDHIFKPVLSFLEILKKDKFETRFVNSASTDCFGDQAHLVLDESSPMQPVSPYAVAKTAAFSTVVNYRKAYGLNVSNGILTNHESPLREAEFVTQKIIQGLKEVKEGSRKFLPLGTTSIARDWLWAGDAASALGLIAGAESPDDFIVASGRSSTLDEIIAIACDFLGLNSQEVIIKDESLVRPLEIEKISVSPRKIRTELGWQPRFTLEDLLQSLLESRLFPNE